MQNELQGFFFLPSTTHVNDFKFILKVIVVFQLLLNDWVTYKITIQKIILIIVSCTQQKRIVHGGGGSKN